MILLKYNQKLSTTEEPLPGAAGLWGDTVTNGDCQNTQTKYIKHIVLCHKIQFRPVGLDSRHKTVAGK